MGKGTAWNAHFKKATPKYMLYIWKHNKDIR